MVDHAAIDLDQKAMEEQLALRTSESFVRARRIYREGGQRRSYALINLTEPLAMSLTKDAHFFVGKRANGEEVTGNAFDNYPKGATQIGIRYTTIDDQMRYQECNVGALVKPKLNGCLAHHGSVKQMSNDPKLEYNYTYRPEIDNKNPRHM